MDSESVILTPASWTEPLHFPDAFGNDAPLEVDVGCGKGRFLVARASANPGINYLGIDRLLRRLRKVDKKIRRHGLTNARLLRIEAAYAIAYLLPPRAVSAFYIFFPDPWPKRRHHRRRLFSREFLNALDRTLVDGGRVFVATDHLDYYEDIRALFGDDPRFEEGPPLVPADDERTEFEIIFLNQQRPVGRCSFEKAAPTAASPLPRNP